MVEHKRERESAFLHFQVCVEIPSLPITATHTNNSPFIAHFTGNTPILLHKCKLESAFLHVQVRVENPSLPITATQKITALLLPILLEIPQFYPIKHGFMFVFK